MNRLGKKILAAVLLTAAGTFTAVGVQPAAAAGNQTAAVTQPAAATRVQAVPAAAIDFRKAAEAQRTELINFRRDLHEYPELGENTKRSAGKITEELTKMGIPYVVDSHNNVIGKITGGQPGKKIAIRADYDALPLQEETGLPYSSKIPGQMHACGHDIHAAGLIGAAKILNDNKAKLKGTVYVCFQVAEETTGGARYIVDYLKQQGGVDNVVGIHTIPMFRHGEYGTRAGILMSGNVDWKIAVKGVGGHGSQPWAGVDPNKPAAEILLRVSNMLGTVFPASDPFVVYAGMIQGGTSGNIVPDSAVVEGGIRYYNPKYIDEIPAAMTKIAQNVAASYGTTAELTFDKEHAIAPVDNSQSSVDLAAQVCKELGFKITTDLPALTGSDDMADLVNTFTGVYVFSGTLKPGQPVIYQHNPKFDPDEESIMDNAAFLAAYAYDFLNGNQQPLNDKVRLQGDISQVEND